MERCNLGSKISVKAKDLTVEYGVDLERSRIPGYGRFTKIPQSVDVEIRDNRTTYSIGGAIDTHKEDARPGDKQVLRLGIQHRLTNAVIEAKAQQEFHDSGNRITQVSIGHTSKPRKGATLKVVASYRDAKFAERLVWSPPKGAAQATVEYRQAFPITKTLAGEVGVRGGLVVAEKISPIVGGGIGLRQSIGRNGSLSAYGLFGYGATIGMRLNHQW